MNNSTQSLSRFHSRIALVTGAASGIGAAIVARFIDEGANVIAWDINLDRLHETAKQYGDRMMAQRVDVRDPEAIDVALTEAVKAMGKLDIVVNAAGLVGPNAPFWTINTEDWNRVININLTGTFQVNRAATPHLLKNKWGRIVNIASVTAKEGPKDIGPYAASKAAIVSLTKSMGKDLAGTGVLVNAIAPALIQTELLAQLTPEYYDAAISRIPLGRAGTLDEVAAMVAWISSDECSFCTGAVFDLSGGRGQ